MPPFSENRSVYCARRAEALQGQLGDRADAGRRVDEDRQHGAVPEAHRVRDIDRLEERAGLLDADLRRLAFDHGVALGLDGRRRVDDAGVAVDQPVEEPPKRRQVELLGRDAHGPGPGGSRRRRRGRSAAAEAAALDLGEELLDGVQVVLAGVGVGELGLEELLPGELGGPTRGFDDRRGVAGGDRLAPARYAHITRTASTGSRSGAVERLPPAGAPPIL